MLPRAAAKAGGSGGEGRGERNYISHRASRGLRWAAANQSGAAARGGPGGGGGCLKWRPQSAKGMAEPADYPPFQLGKPRFEQVPVPGGGGSGAGAAAARAVPHGAPPTPLLGGRAPSSPLLASSCALIGQRPASHWLVPLSLRASAPRPLAGGDWLVPPCPCGAGGWARAWGPRGRGFETLVGTEGGNRGGGPLVSPLLVSPSCPHSVVPCPQTRCCEAGPGPGRAG